MLEYASEGPGEPTGAPYTNRYIPVLTITDRKVTHWRDYLDPVAVFDALGWPSALLMDGASVLETVTSICGSNLTQLKSEHRSRILTNFGVV